MSGGEEGDGHLFSWFSLSHCFIFKNYEFKVCLYDSPTINQISLIFFREGNHTMLQTDSRSRYYKNDNGSPYPNVFL